jgi:hypothetical protein
MRRPNWPPGTPPPRPRDVHEFRLPAVPLLLLSEERPDQEKKRRRLVRREAYRFYEMVAEHLGEEDAKKLLSLFISNPRRGSPGGSVDRKLRERLLAEHDKRSVNALRYKSQGAKNIKARMVQDLAPEFGKKPAALRKALDRYLAERTEQTERDARRRALRETRRGLRPVVTPFIEDSDTKSMK